MQYFWTTSLSGLLVFVHVVFQEKGKRRALFTSRLNFNVTLLFSVTQSRSRLPGFMLLKHNFFYGGVVG